MAIPCKDRARHRPTAWAVLDRNWCRESSYSQGWPTPGAHTLACSVCHVAWRSRAKYADELPTVEDANPIARRIAELVEEYPRLVELTYWNQPAALAGANPFLRSVGTRLTSGSTLSGKQILVADKIIDGWVWQLNEAAEQAAVMRARREALGERLAPVGPQVVVGTVEKVWTPERHADALVDPLPRMELRADQGFTVEVTVPKVLRQALKPSRLVGRRVELHAKLKRNPDDWTMAWGSNPLQRTALLPSNAALL